MTTATPWTEMLGQALRAGIAPEAFWRLSLSEWRMLSAGPATPALARVEFNRLREMWPDE